MNADAFTDDVPDEVELVDGAWRYNPDPLPPDIEPDQELIRLRDCRRASPALEAG